MVLAEAPRGVPFDHGAFELVLEDIEPLETMP
jgi:hypothetical protein